LEGALDGFNHAVSIPSKWLNKLNGLGIWEAADVPVGGDLAWVGPGGHRELIAGWGGGRGGSWHSTVGDEVEVELDKFHLGLGYGEVGVECVVGMLDDGGFGGGLRL
jgi:hypothetical protein